MRNPKDFSHELPQEVWVGAANRIMTLGTLLAEATIAENKNGRGQSNADDLLTDIQLAYTAMMYVTRFAKDKCGIITTKD